MTTLVNAAGTVQTKAAIPKTTDRTVIYYKITNDTFETYHIPTQKAGTFNGLRLKWPAGYIISDAEFNAAFAAATFVSVTPATGTTAGGTAVTIKGTNLRGVSGVLFLATAATSVVVVDEETITCVTPANTSGAKSITLQDDAGDVVAAAAFTYA